MATNATDLKEAKEDDGHVTKRMAILSGAWSHVSLAWEWFAHKHYKVTFSAVVVIDLCSLYYPPV